MRVLHFGPFRLDEEQNVLWAGDRLVRVGPKVVRTLAVLALRHGEVVPTNTIMTQVWPDTAVESASVSHNISVLRKLLREHAGDGFRIETCPKRGYRFVCVTGIRKGPPPPEANDVLSATWEDHRAVPPVVSETGKPNIPMSNRHFSDRRRVAWGLAGVCLIAAIGFELWFAINHGSQSPHSSPSFSIKELGYWFAAPLLQIGTLVAMFKRKINRSLFFFFAYNCCAILSTMILYTGFRNNYYSTYYYTFFASCALFSLISLCVIYQVGALLVRYRSNSASKHLAVIRILALAAGLSMALWIVLSIHPDRHNPFTYGTFLFEKGVRWAQCLLLVPIILFRKHLRITSGNIIFGITLGYALDAVANILVLLVAAQRREFSFHGLNLSYVTNTIHVTVCLIWLAYMWAGSWPRSLGPSTLNADEARITRPVAIEPSILDSVDRDPKHASFALVFGH